MSTVEWGREKCLALIEDYENMRILWDTKHPHYYAKNKKQDAWETIASKFNIDCEEMKRKVNSLLGSFRRERSRERRCYAAGKGAKIRFTRKSAENRHARCLEIQICFTFAGWIDYVSKWFAYDKLRFLLENREDREEANLSNAENVSTWIVYLFE